MGVLMLQVEKGKGFKGLLATLMGLATRAAEKFKAEGLNLEKLLDLGVATFGKGWVQGILNRIFRRSQPAVTKVLPSPFLLLPTCLSSRVLKAEAAATESKEKAEEAAPPAPAAAPPEEPKKEEEPAKE